MTNVQTTPTPTPIGHGSSEELLSYDNSASFDFTAKFPRLEEASDANVSFSPGAASFSKKETADITANVNSTEKKKISEAQESYTILTDDVEDDLHFSMGTPTDDISSSDGSEEGDDEGSRSMKSSMTFGSAHHPEDSFAGVSNTGLSSVDSSLDDSQYYFRDTFPNRKMKNQNNNSISVGKNNHDGNESSHGNSNGPKHPLNRELTRRMPRLTVQTHPHTMVLLEGGNVNIDKHSYAGKGKGTTTSTAIFDDTIPLKTPLSQGTAGTDPITPMSAIIDEEEKEGEYNDGKKDDHNDEDGHREEGEEEFPPLTNEDWNKTVQFTVSSGNHANSRSHSHTHSRSLMSNGIPRTLDPLRKSSNINESMSMSVSTTVSTPMELPSFDTSYIRQRRMTKEHRLRARAFAERDFYNNRLKEQVLEYGPQSVEAARAMANLGSSLLRCKAFSDALAVYKRAVTLLRVHFGEDSMIVARVLDKIGVAASMSPTDENLDWALLALKEALSIRISFLGPHHCDCIETMNNIAGVYLHKREWAIARDLYLDVMTTRAVIFGRDHGSIAVTAQTLGKVFTHLSDLPNALRHLELALEIYKGESMKLRDNHPLVMKVTKSIVSLEHLMASLG